MTDFDPSLLDEQRRDPLPDDDELLAADPSAAWGALVRLRSDAVATGAPVAPVPELEALRRWSEQRVQPGDEAVPWYARQSLLVAEMLEATLDAGAEGDSRQLAAAPEASPPEAVWPARYGGEGWRIVLAVDEAGQLYLEIEEAPPFIPDLGSLSLPDIDHAVEGSLAAGSEHALGPAASLLGDEDFNPVRTVEILGSDDSSWSILRMPS